MLIELKDYIKTIGIGEHFSIGTIDDSKMKSIGVYGDGGGRRIEAIGKDSSYDRANMRVLVHWNKNAKEAEEAARGIYEALRNITGVDMSGIFVQYIDLTQNEPVFVGTDKNGIYEYVITLSIYYRR